MNLLRNILAAALLGAGLCHAAEGEDAPEIAVAAPPAAGFPAFPDAPANSNAEDGSFRTGGPRRDGGRGGRFDLREMGAALKEKYPDEYAEIEALRDSDPRGAMEKIRALAEKAGVMPSRGDAPGMSPRDSQTVTVDRNFRRRRMKRVNSELERLYPDEFRALQAMREDDPEEARYYFVELAARLPQDTMDMGRRGGVRTASGTSAESGSKSGKNTDGMPFPGDAMPPPGMMPSDGNFPGPGGAPGGGPPSPGSGTSDGEFTPDWGMTFDGF